MINLKKKIFYLMLLGIWMHPLEVNAEMTLAVIAPKAGTHIEAGTELFNGAKLAIKEINENGGLNGEKLEVLEIDDRCDDRLAVSTAEMLALLKSKKIGLVVGPYCSNRFNDTADIYEKAKIFQIVPTTVSYNAGNSEKKGQILLLGTKAQMSEDFFRYYNQNFAGLKVGFIYDDTPQDGYAEMAKTLSDEFRRYGKSELLKFYVLNNTHTNYEDLANATIKDNINIAFVLGKDEQTAEFISALKEKDENKIIFTNKRNISPKILRKLKNKANGIYMMALPSLKDSLMFTENLVNLRLLGMEPKGMETYSYMAVKLWSDLVESVNSFSYDLLSNAANTGEMKEKWSEFLLHSGSVKSSKYIVEIYQDGEFKQVY